MYKKIVGRDGFLEYFWAKVDTSGDGCWEWQGALSPSGYGHCAGRKLGFSQRAHRAIWQALNGEIPETLQVCHTCDNPKCCRPDHLFLGTCADNLADRNRKERQARGSRGGRAKITEMDAKEIKAMLREGISLANIAKQYPISEVAVWQIQRGKNWAHVE